MPAEIGKSAAMRFRRRFASELRWGRMPTRCWGRRVAASARLCCCISYQPPAWFASMDRNGDRDLSRDEFLALTQQFGELDGDGDGLVSVVEAIKRDREVK